MTIQEADEISLFLWADAVVNRDKKKKGDKEDKGIIVKAKEDQPADKNKDKGYKSSKEYDFKTMY